MAETRAGAGRDGLLPPVEGPARLAVLASGSGTNFQALLDRFGTGGEDARVVLLVASRPGIGALERAERAGVPAAVLPGAARDGAGRSAAGGDGPGASAAEGGGADGSGPEAAFLLRTLGEAGADVVVLAGWLRLVPAAVVRAYRGRMLNVHPALLPAFGGRGMYGRHVHRAVIDRGVRVTGATVHFVDEVYDRGPIVAQWPVPVLEGDDPATLAARVLEVEHHLLPAAVEAVAAGRAGLDEDGRCRWRGALFGAERFVLGGGGGSAPPPDPGPAPDPGSAPDAGAARDPGAPRTTPGDEEEAEQRQE